MQEKTWIRLTAVVLENMYDYKPHVALNMAKWSLEVEGEGGSRHWIPNGAGLSALDGVAKVVDAIDAELKKIENEM